jgi:hypothetical protein
VKIVSTVRYAEDYMAPGRVGLTICHGGSSTAALEEVKDDEHAKIGADGAGDSEDDEADIARVIDNQAAIQLRHGGQHQRPDSEAEDIDGDDKAGQHGVGALELDHDLRDSGGEHG